MPYLLGVTMNFRISLLVLAVSAGTAAYAQLPSSALTQNSRAQVLADLEEARRSGSIPSGEAIGYPYADRSMSMTAEAMSPPETNVLGGPPSKRMSAAKGSLSRAQVIADLHEARRAGTIPSGEAIGYPFTPRPMTITAGAPPSPDTKVLGAPPAAVESHDGHRFIGGEAGFAPIGSRAYGR